MRSSRFALAFLVVTTVALLAGLPAAAKEGVTATLLTGARLEAAPGTRIRVIWTLSYRDERDGRRYPFGAAGIFVRLLSASRSGAETVFVDCTGRCAATVRVPKGGIRDIQIGLRGYGRNGRPVDKLFPITNDPVRKRAA